MSPFLPTPARPGTPAPDHDEATDEMAVVAVTADEVEAPAAEDLPQVEREMAFDMVRRGLLVAPVLLVASGLVWGWVGVSSCAYGLALVFANFLLAAGMLGWAAKIGPNALLATALGGFLLRMLILVLAISVVKDQTWIDLAALGATILVTYLGLLFWETRFVSASLAFPGLRPRTKGA